jgi:XTP/dITP diphosphohydrolase
MELLVATRNKKKLQEIKEILKGDLKITSLADYQAVPRIVENGKTFKENAAKKALKISRFFRKLTLGEDSGLCVDVLALRPGVYSSRFAGKGKSDRKNNLKLLHLLEGVPLKKRKAHYICAVALADENGLLGVVEGRCDGLIAFSLKGHRGFGYDPLFLIPSYGKTFGQLGERIKHKMSHRYHALQKAAKIIRQYLKTQEADKNL